MSSSKTWIVIFRCFHCARNFTIRHITFDRVSALQAIHPCPFCAARPMMHSPAAGQAIKAHKLVELSADNETVYRKYPGSDTWHFTPDCSQWPNERFLALDAEPRVGEFCNECRAKKFEGSN